MENSIGSEGEGYDKLPRDANMITNKVSNFGAVCIVQVSHNLIICRIIDLSLYEVEKPRMERVTFFKDNCVSSMVFT